MISKGQGGPSRAFRVPWFSWPSFWLFPGSSLASLEEPKGRPGGPGDPKSPRGRPPQPFYLSLVLLAFLLALPRPPWNSIKLA